MAARKSLIDDNDNEPVVHITTLKDVLYIFANGIALQPDEKKIVMDYAEGLDKPVE